MMKNAAVFLVLLSAGAWATPSGKRWFLPPCATVACNPNEQCVQQRCVPIVRLAASIDNLGGMTLTGGSVPYSAVALRTRAAYERWTSPQVAECSTSWNIAWGGTYSSPAGTTAIDHEDAQNNVIWLSGAAWRYSGSTLGLTTATFYTDTGEIFDGDTEFNNNATWASDGRRQAYDVETVVLHEAGHFLGLSHTSNAPDAVMSPNFSGGQLKRALGLADLDDVCSVYSQAGGQGSVCNTSSDCTGLRVCEAVVGASKRMCTEACDRLGDACPTGYSCQPSAHGHACLPQVGAPDQCLFCAAGQDCSTGVCLRDLGTGGTFCSLSCTSDPQCGAGYACHMTPAGGFCLPTGRCSNQCLDSGDCPVAYTCTQGECLPNGKPGDRCEVSEFCRSTPGGACSVCVLEPDSTSVAFCRSCCAQGTGTGLCQGCQMAVCTGAESCAGLVNGVDGVCLAVATGDPGLCMSCPSGTCSSGYECIAGRCRASCNPESPGECSACFATGGKGVCACADEIAFKSEPCGLQALGAFAACSAGLACVGSPQTVCRSRCDLTKPSSCPAGELCQLAGTQAVCQPATPGSRCAPCTSGAQCGAGLTCHLGRCYEPCNVNVATTCATCVSQQAQGVGLCACDDQLVPEGGSCGSEPSIRGCKAGTRCVGGTCQSQCNPRSSSGCPASKSCQPYADGNYCLDSNGDGGQPNGGRADAGTSDAGAGPSTGSIGCGCTSSEAATLWLPMILLWVWRARRSSSTRPAFDLREAHDVVLPVGL